MYVCPNAPCMEYVLALARKLTQPCRVVRLLWSSLLLSWRHLGFAISKSPGSIPTSRSCTSNRFPTMPKGPPHSSMSGTNQPRHKWWYGRATSSTWILFCHENWSCPPNIRYYLTNLRATKVTFSRVSRGQNMAKPISEATTSHPFQQVFVFLHTDFFTISVSLVVFSTTHFWWTLGMVAFQDDGRLTKVFWLQSWIQLANLAELQHRNNVYNKYIICHILCIVNITVDIYIHTCSYIVTHIYIYVHIFKVFAIYHIYIYIYTVTI